MSDPLNQVLVHLDATDSCADRLAIGRQLVRDHGGTLSVLYAATPAFLEPGPDGMPSGPYNRLDDERRARARDAFDRIMAQPGPAAEWAQTDTYPLAAHFARLGQYADLLVLGQRDPADPNAGGVPADFPEDVLHATGRAGLVVPYIGWNRPVGRTVAIAWRESPEAVRAVAAALPILRKAGMTHVLTWRSGREAAGAGERLARYLAAHGVTARVHDGGQAGAPIGELLLSRAADLGVDLLVMGCFGHSRAREWLLGGASRTLLAAMTVPVLMAH